MEDLTQRRRVAPAVPHLIKLALVAAVTLLAGCASTSKENTIPSTGPTMEEIYREHMKSMRSSEHRFEEDLPRRSPQDADVSRYTRTSMNEINSRFGRLPNPDLVMFVYPHLSDNSRYPVPGYSTVFPMYETVEYAMPGETPPHDGHEATRPSRPDGHKVSMNSQQ